MATPIPEQHVHDTFVIEDVITELHVAVGIEKLLARIAPHCQSSDAAAGRADLLSECRVRIRAALVAMGDDDDDTEKFACLVGHRVMCGSFAGASKLPVGKEIKAVVAKRDGVLVARALLSEDMGFIWANCVAGAKADRWAGFAMAFYLFCFSVVVQTVLIFFVDTVASMSRLDMLGWLIAITGAICVFIGLCESGTPDPRTDPATDIFRKLGFADPEYVSLYAYQYCTVYPSKGMPARDLTFEQGNIFCYKKAIEDGKLRLAHR